ncbi:hypothetical protein OTU49_004388 [Cherax quadricarinatus]|uniref:peptidylprolyl isomerase n=1 Tax=Cherax quadricarinatus TaxID=27406 RepID=A0AAW0XCU6_CHEQU
MSVGDPETDVIDITPDKDGGVLKQILKPGEGEATPWKGDRVFVHYVGTLAEDGSKFDSSRDRGEHFVFTLGKREVIKSWDLGVATMKKGEIARLTCKSEYAYGEKGSPPKIPPNATLVFEVELLKWEGEDISPKKDGGIMRRTIVQGEGYTTPNEGAVVDVHIIGRVNGTVFDDRELKFPLGEGMEHHIPEGLESALGHFKKGEKSTISLSPTYAYGSSGNVAIGVPPGATIEYDVEMRSFVKGKESWEMDQEEKIEQAKACKDRGTNFLKQQKYQLAAKQYKKIIDLLENDSGLDDEKNAERHTVLLAGHLNLAMAYLKLNENTLAQEHASKALEMDKKNVKAYFRRGQAYMNMGEAQLAKKDFEACLDLEQTNKAAKQQLHHCIARIKADKLKEKQIYGGMFDKFARQDRVREAEASNKDVKQGDGEWSIAEEKNDAVKSEKVC